MKMFRKPYYTHIHKYTIHEINLYLYIYVCIGIKLCAETNKTRIHTHLNTYTHN